MIAIEPALAPADSLAFAEENGTAPMLTACAPLRWWVDVDVREP